LVITFNRTQIFNIEETVTILPRIFQSGEIIYKNLTYGTPIIIDDILLIKEN